MCYPLIISAGLAALSMAQSYTANQAQNTAAKASIKSAKKAEALNLDALDDKSEEIKDKFDMEGLERTRQAARERGKLQVSMAESGLFGNTSLMEMADTYLQDSYDQSLIKQNESNQLRQVENEKLKASNTAQDSINKAKSAKISGLNMAFKGAAAGVAGAAQGYTAGTAIQGMMPAGSETPTNEEISQGQIEVYNQRSNAGGWD